MVSVTDRKELFKQKWECLPMYFDNGNASKKMEKKDCIFQELITRHYEYSNELVSIGGFEQR